jgi:uncharacterized membrane protein YeiH
VRADSHSIDRSPPEGLAIQVESRTTRESLVSHTDQLPGRSRLDRLLFPADIAGTLVFAVEGAMAAVNGNLDLIGIMTLAFCTALGGGIIRDTLLGALPPAALRDWRYSTIPLSAAVLVFFLYHYVRRIPVPYIQVLDAAGLAIFAIAGTQKAMLHKMNPLVAVLLGTITGVGGGTIRDVLLNQVPSVLRFEVYATAALVGSVCMIAATRMRLPPIWAASLGGVICFLLRIASLWQHWSVPRALG